MTGGPLRRKRSLLENAPMIRTTCPNCATKLGIAESRAGKNCKCPTCAHRFRAPVPTAIPSSATQTRAGSGPSFESSTVATDLELARDEPSLAGISTLPGRGAATRTQAPQPGETKPSAVEIDRLEEVDELEEFDEDDERIDDQPAHNEDQRVQPRARRRRHARRTSIAVYAITAMLGLVWCAAVPIAYHFRYAGLVVAFAGLPLIFMSFKWRVLGIAGVVYLASGAAFFFTHSGGIPPIPPPEGATPELVDAHCRAMLHSRHHIEARNWLALSGHAAGPTLRLLIQEAYHSGAAEVRLTDYDRVDSTMRLTDLKIIVVLPRDEAGRDRVREAYQRTERDIAIGNAYIFVNY